MRARELLGLAAAVAGLGLFMPGPARAVHDADEHSANTTLVGSSRLGGLGDMAFTGDLAVVARFDLFDGAAHGISVLDVSDPSSPPRELSRFTCTGAGWDVSVWGHLVFLSVDDITATADGGCAAELGTGFQGIKIVSIADPARPVHVGSVEMPCSGSHNHTLLHDPGGRRVLLYAASSDYVDRGRTGCDAVVAVSLDAPASADLVAAIPGDEASSCHDFAVHAARRLLAGACVGELRLYDIAEPTAPRLLSRTVNPAQTFNHSVGFANDGATLVSGEETAQSSGATGGCTGGTASPYGALWFYDVGDPASPALRGYHQLGRGTSAATFGGAGCSVHNFGVVPTREDRDLLTAAWYSGGVSVVDFSDPAAPREVAHYLPDRAEPDNRGHYWGAYWYRDRVFATNTFESGRQALDVFATTGLGPVFRLSHLNPQTQEPLQDAALPVGPPPAPDGTGPGAAPGTGGSPATPCRPARARLRVRGARRILRADLLRGTRRLRRLRVRGREVRVDLRGLARGTYRVRTASRRVTAC